MVTTPSAPAAYRMKNTMDANDRRTTLKSPIGIRGIFEFLGAIYRVIGKIRVNELPDPGPALRATISP